MQKARLLNGPEVTLDEALAEPIVRLLMQRDGLHAEDFRFHARLDDHDLARLHDPASDSLCRLSPLCDGILPILGSTAALFVLVTLATHGFGL